MRAWQILCSVVFFAMLNVQPAAPARAEHHKFKGASASIVVAASPKIIYEAIWDLRNDKGSNVRQIERDDKHSLLEEKFEGLPIIGSATCTYIETYDLYNRLDYHMLKSDKFKAYEGSWVITPTGDPVRNQVQLNSFVDTGIRLPFAQQLTNSSTLSGIHKRLQEVKQKAEARQAAVDSAGGAK